LPCLAALFRNTLSPRGSLPAESEREKKILTSLAARSALALKSSALWSSK
jgi:hypothetical protein